MKKTIAVLMLIVIMISVCFSCVNEKVEENFNEGPFVYTTPTGSKFHFSRKCAGDRARHVPYDKIKEYYEPCKKCTRK